MNLAERLSSVQVRIMKSRICTIISLIRLDGIISHLYHSASLATLNHLLTRSFMVLINANKGEEDVV